MKKILLALMVMLFVVSLLASGGEEATEAKTEKSTTCKTKICGSTTCENTSDKPASSESVAEASEVNNENTSLPKITFLELGSTTCIPCKKMKPVLKSISEKYGDQIKVEFIDLKEDRAAAKKYKIRMMPTQVFLNEKGEEVHRHVGYYPEEQIEEFLQSQGLIPAGSK